jgi:hypothetical protein
MTDEPIPKEDLEEPSGDELADREESPSDPDLPDPAVGDLPRGAPKEPGLPPPRD